LVSLINRIYLGPKYFDNLESSFTRFKLRRSFFCKNINVLKSLDQVDKGSDFWNLGLKGSVIKVYPNNARISGSGNLLIANQEESGKFNTNNFIARDSN
jgi:hypothetical protein